MVLGSVKALHIDSVATKDYDNLSLASARSFILPNTLRSDQEG